MDEGFNPEKFTEMLKELGKAGREAIDKLDEYLHEAGEDGDIYVEEAFAQLESFIEKYWNEQ